MGNILCCMLPRKYSTYIFWHFAIDFCLWFLTFFAILLALKQMDGYDDYTFFQNLWFSFIRSFGNVLDNVNVITVLSCIFFFIRMRKMFDFNILKTFGLTSGQILCPIILFIIIFGIFKTFALRPVCIKLENHKKIQMEKWKKGETRFLKSGTSFTLIDDEGKGNYSIIQGVYNQHNEISLKFSSAIFSQYRNNNLTAIYAAQQVVLKDHVFTLSDVQKISIKNKDVQRFNLKEKKIKTKITSQELSVRIRNENKLKKTIMLGLYDHIRLLKKSHIHNNIHDDVGIHAKTYIANEIISFFNAILCILFSFLLCTVNARNAHIAKSSLECFIIYFLILRIFHSLENIVKISDYGAFTIVGLSLSLCIFTYLAILNKDWCGYYRKTIFSVIRNDFNSLKTLLFKLFKTKQVLQ